MGTSSSSANGGPSANGHVEPERTQDLRTLSTLENSQPSKNEPRATCRTLASRAVSIDTDACGRELKSRHVFRLRFFIDRPIFASVLSIIFLLGGGGIARVDAPRRPVFLDITPPTVESLPPFIPAREPRRSWRTPWPPLSSSRSTASRTSLYMSSQCTERRHLQARGDVPGRRLRPEHGPGARAKPRGGSPSRSCPIWSNAAG